MSTVERTTYGGIVNWCETATYKSCVMFVHPKHKTGPKRAEQISILVMSGRLKLHRIDNDTGLSYFSVLLTGDSAVFEDNESYFVEGIDECHFLEICPS